MTLEAQIAIATADLQQAQDAFAAARVRLHEKQDILLLLREDWTYEALADPQPGDLFDTSLGFRLLVTERHGEELVLRGWAGAYPFPEEAPVLRYSREQLARKHPRIRIEARNAALGSGLWAPGPEEEQPLPHPEPRAQSPEPPLVPMP